MQIITSKDNKIIKFATMLNSSAKDRKKEGLFITEGFRLCGEALKNNAEIKYLLLSDLIPDKYRQLADDLSEKAENTVIIADSLFSKISDTQNPQGVMCICSASAFKELSITKTGKYVALEHISDPLNLGTILRTADALGIDGIILSDDCCDIFSPKVVRGSMGAIFRLPFIIVDNMADFAAEKSEDAFFTAATVVNNADSYITDIKSKDGIIVFIGNEANGLTDATINACSVSITIPMNGHAESLNAAMAAGIVMWEVVRQQRDSNV